MKIFEVLVVGDNFDPETIGCISAESLEDICEKFGIDPKEYFKNDPEDNGYDIGSRNVYFREMKEIETRDQLVSQVKSHVPDPLLHEVVKKAMEMGKRE